MNSMNKLIKHHDHLTQFEDDKIVVFNDDALTVLKLIEDHSIDLCLIDPPYGTTEYVWDQFGDEITYVNFMAEIFCEIERVLKKSGSFYFFHNNFLKIVELQSAINNVTNFKFQQMIVWNKRFPGCQFEDKKNATLFKHSINYPKYVEYCLYYVFENECSAVAILDDTSNFLEYKTYIQSLFDKKGYTYNTEIIVRALYEKVGYKSMQSARTISQRLFNQNRKAFGFILKKHYDALYDILEFDKTYEEIEELISKGKSNISDGSVHHTFNNLKSHHSVWNYDNVKQSEKVHPTEKPLDLIENIIKHSSNEGDVVLDCFAGSGTTGVACKELNRKFIGIELDEGHYEAIKHKIEKVARK